MLGSTDSLTSSNATRATYNYEVDTPMTGSLTSAGRLTRLSNRYIFQKNSNRKCPLQDPILWCLLWTPWNQSRHFMKRENEVWD